jgi:sialic acid synthase SpsE
MIIDGKIVGADKVYIISEIGNNHNGSIDAAIDLIDKSIDCGVDSVKFQIRDANSLYRKRKNFTSEDLGAEYIKDLLSKVELTVDEHIEIRKYCAEKNISYICTPWDEQSVDTLSEFNVAAIKIASADLTNPKLILKAASLNKPIIISTGMSYEHEILRTVKLLNNINAEFIILHCNSAYPAPIDDIHLNYIKKLKTFHPIVGYSGHERGISISLAAVAIGASVIERHITTDRLLEGPDHLSSLIPSEFSNLVNGIRELEVALPSNSTQRIISQGELLNRENLAKSVIAAIDIKKGDLFDYNNLRIASPGQGLAPYELENLIGKFAIRNIDSGEFLYQSDLTQNERVLSSLNFENTWGIPVRYHDYKIFKDKFNPNLIEFHFSFSDLNLNVDDYLTECLAKKLIIHAPDIFENSSVLDLMAETDLLLNQSIFNIEKLIDVSHKILKYFPNCDNAYIVANVGGISNDAPLDINYRSVLYERFFDTFNKINWGKTILIPQNLTPFPWIFGGQRHVNVFMMPDELVNFAITTNIKLCIDMSHLQMTCNHFNLDFKDSFTKLLPFAEHIHICDALGNKGEGVEIGKGDIPWKEVWPLIKNNQRLSFIPEVWQGHKDHGLGFIKALEYLSKL